MPQTSNSLLSPTKFMVARGNHLHTPLSTVCPWHPSMHPSTQPSTHPSMHPSVHPSMHPSAYPSADPFTHPSTHPSMHPLCGPLHASLHAPLHAPLHTPPLCTPPSDWLSIPTTSNHIPAFQILINIES